MYSSVSQPTGRGGYPTSRGRYPQKYKWSQLNKILAQKNVGLQKYVNLEHYEIFLLIGSRKSKTVSTGSKTLLIFYHDQKIKDCAEMELFRLRNTGVLQTKYKLCFNF